MAMGQAWEKARRCFTSGWRRLSSPVARHGETTLASDNPSVWKFLGLAKGILIATRAADGGLELRMQRAERAARDRQFKLLAERWDVSWRVVDRGVGRCSSCSPE